MVLALGVLTGCNGKANATYNDGTYTTFSDEGNGYARLEVTIAEDKITEIKVYEYTNRGIEKDYETYGNANFSGDFLKGAHESLVADIIESNSVEVDLFTGATSTSNKVIKGVERALEKALVEAASTNTYFNGKFMGVVRSEGGAVIVHVTINNDEIIEVVISETRINADGENAKNYETYGNANFTGAFLKEAHETLAAAFVAANGADVDIFTGASSTSNGAIEAVKAALANATR